MKRAVALVVGLGLAGCGFGPGDAEQGGAEMRVTRDFGRVEVESARKTELRPSDTVMRFLQSTAKVTTRYGGAFVQSIDGVAGEGSGGRRDWFYYVNGIWAPSGAADRKLEPGDVVQWDYRRWDAAPTIPAIVGAFPEPFVHGEEGKRSPTRVECVTRDDTCDTVVDALTKAGAAPGLGTIGAEARGAVLRVAVGTWEGLRGLETMQVLEEEPGRSGVFARFAGDDLQLLDERGRVARDAPAGSGLLAAIRPEGQAPVWIVTGVDAAGVARAAALLDAAKLRNAYAIVAFPGGNEKLPVGQQP